MKDKNLQFSYGTDISSVEDIKKFMNFICKKFSIKKESGIVEKISKSYLADPIGKDHIVFHSNAQGEWFCHFLSDADVVNRFEISE